MFSASSFNQPLHGWDVRNVERFDAMLKSCTALNVEFAWSAPAAVSMEEMFHGATASVVLRDTSELISTARMFRRASRFNSRLVMTNTSNVTDMSEMLSGATALRRTVRLDMSRVMRAHGMFDGCPDEAMVRASLDASAVPALRTQLGARLFARAKAIRIFGFLSFVSLARRDHGLIFNLHAKDLSNKKCLLRFLRFLQRACKLNSGR